jgi:glycosyltransferase involved in cell wall biosynthesis
MIARRPVLVSSSVPLARTVRHSNAGLVFEAGDSDSCAKAIVELLQNPQLCLKLSNLGYRYVMEQGHNWEEESAPKLLQAYDELLRGCN